MSISRDLRGRLRSAFAFIFAACFVLPLTVSDASAQQRQRVGPNPTYTIRVFLNEMNTCVYEIADYDDQDLFLIRPGGSINFVAESVNAAVTIERHADRGRHYGMRGLDLRSPSSFFLNNDSMSVMARGAIPQQGNQLQNRHTRHKVWISCLVDGIEILAVDSVTAMSRTSLYDEGADGDNLSEMRRSGPQLMETSQSGEVEKTDDPPRRDTGGPTMEIDDP